MMQFRVLFYRVFPWHIIGLGIRAPESSIGVLLSQGQKIMQQYPNQVFFPAVVISLLMIAFNMLSNGLRDAFDPTQRGA